MRIGLIALDERPVNTRYPAMIANIAGAELVQPSIAALSHRRKPADPEYLAGWLRDQAPRLDALIVSLEMLGYGGLIPSRTTEDSAAQVIHRLDVLREVKQKNPSLMILGFGLIMRISGADNNFEEPLYWSQYGSRLYQYSQLIDQQLQGQAVTAQIAELTQQIPPEYVHDFMTRRLRNHIVNLDVLELAADQIFDSLVISSDDTSAYGLGTREKRWLTEWAERSLDGTINLLMYPGADEVGCALLAQALNLASGQVPKFALHYAIPGDENVTAPFEDGPVYITLERQIRAVGGQIVSNIDEADFIVAVNTPSRQHPAWIAQRIASEQDHRTPYLKDFVKQIQAWISEGRRVILTDVAYPNGADPVLIDLLIPHVEIGQLAAYGAWNTAGNTIGTALAQGIASGFAGSNAQFQAQQRFLAHRFVEDWGYMLDIRAQIYNRYVERHGTSEIAPEHLEAVKAEIEAGLRQELAQLPHFTDTWQLIPGSIRLPWDRFFEVDFDLEPRPQS